jgi:uncharacterized sulfatase
VDRRSFIKLAGAAGIASAAEQVNAGAPVKSHSELRQAVIILGESVRYDMLNCNVKTGLHTPNLDRLAVQGARFDRAYNCQPVCGPARSAIWTGLYPHSNGVWGNSMPLGDTTHTIGQRLTDKEIHCAFIGKWHLDGFDYFGTGRPAPGWDKEYWYDMRDYLSELSPADRVRSRNPATGDDPSWTAEHCFGHRCTQRALDFLDKHQNEDFLLVVAYDEPHGPSLCPIEYSKLYEDYVFPSNANVNDALQHKPEEQRVWADGWLTTIQPPIRDKHFFGSHTFIDHEIGRVLDKVEQRAPGAMLMYTSDHGVFLESHRLTDKGPAMYDEITRVPFLVKWPGHTPTNVTSSGLVSHIDISGTLMEFFGFEVPKTLEGGSMLSLLKDPTSSGRSEVFIEFGRYEVDHDGFGGFQPIRCIFDGRYKLSVHLMTSDELYDIESDPSEMENLIDSENELASRNDLHDRLLNWMNVSRDPFRGYYWGRRSWRSDFPVSWQNSGMTRQRESDGYLPRELDYDTGMPMQIATRPKS